jgi:hypothetical protein
LSEPAAAQIKALRVGGGETIWRARLDDDLVIAAEDGGAVERMDFGGETLVREG